jgi:succinoglycan biosynthesis protein ExoA
VQSELPLVTIIVPTKPGQAEIKAVDAARRLDYPKDKIEIIVARGKQPAIQRNHAIREARGEIIYFLDDDSQPAPDVLRRAVERFHDPAVQMVGGPNLCPADAPFIERVFAVALASWIAFGPSRARYDRVGKTRASGEKELILCNLLARRAPLLELGGFDEALYPNEENALMDDLQRRGGKLIYDPDVMVHRRPRATLKSFIKMLVTYGRGRAEQFRLHPTPGSALNFVPPLFVLYLLMIPAMAKLGWFDVTRIAFTQWPSSAGTISSSAYRIGIGWIPLIAYSTALLAQTLANLRFGFLHAVCAFPLLFATHVFYGLGFWRGLFTSIKKSKPATTEVLIERLSP